MSPNDWAVVILLLVVGCIAFGVILGALLVSGHRERRDYEGAHRTRRGRTELVSQEHRPGPPWGDREGWG